MSLLLVALGGFCGAVSRYAVSRWCLNHIQSHFPYGTFIVNVLGSFLLGILIGSEQPHPLMLLWGAGFMGSFTTFSTFKFENLVLLSNQKRLLFYVYLGLMYGVGLLAGAGGYALGKWL